MPAPRYRSRTYRRVRKNTPSGINKIYYTRRLPKAAHCSECGDVLKGIPRGRPAEIKNLTKSKKRPDRPYGGVLCSRCMRKMIVKKARQNV